VREHDARELAAKLGKNGLHLGHGGLLSARKGPGRGLEGDLLGRGLADGCEGPGTILHLSRSYCQHGEYAGREAGGAGRARESVTGGGAPVNATSGGRHTNFGRTV
jgi:hypothetical protein